MPPLAAVSFRDGAKLPHRDSTSTAAIIGKPITMRATQPNCAWCGGCLQFSFNYLVNAGEERGWDCETERLRGFEVQDGTEACRMLEWQFRRLSTFENAINQGRHAPEAFLKVHRVRHQPTIAHEKLELVDRGQPMLSCEVKNSLPVEGRQRVGDHEDRIRHLSRHGGERFFKIV